MTIFDISNLQIEELKKAVFFLINFLVFNTVKKEKEARQKSLMNNKLNRTQSKNYKRQNTMLFIDEAHILLENQYTSYFYKNIVKRARKYQLGVVSITQNVEDYINDNHNIGKAILSNAETTFLLKQSKGSLNDLSNLYDISIEDQKTLNTFDIGNCILIKENLQYYLKFIDLDE